MATSQEKTTVVLNELIETCKDGQKGFASAAEAIKDPTLKVLLMEYSNQRAKFAFELQKEVRMEGEKPETSGSAVGALHRGWIDLKAAITGKNEHAIISECERGEDAAKEAYEKALDGEDLPATLIPLVERQYQQIQEAHERIRSLRDGEPAVTQR